MMRHTGKYYTTGYKLNMRHTGSHNTIGYNITCAILVDSIPQAINRKMRHTGKYHTTGYKQNIRHTGSHYTTGYISKKKICAILVDIYIPQAIKKYAQFVLFYHRQRIK